MRVEIPRNQRTATVTLRGGPGARRTIQAEVFRWRQRNGEDVYEPTGELLVNPPLFFLAPDATQVVRIGAASGTSLDRSVEQAFRVYFTEVPPAPESKTPGLRLALRLGVPVFFKPDRSAPPALLWSAQLGDGEVQLAVENKGTVHARLTELKVLPDKGDAAIAKAGGVRVVLPGARLTWRLPPQGAVTAGPARVSTVTETGLREFPIVLEAR